MFVFKENSLLCSPLLWSDSKSVMLIPENTEMKWMTALARYISGSQSFKYRNLTAGTDKCSNCPVQEFCHFLRDTKLVMKGQILDF